MRLVPRARLSARCFGVLMMLVIAAPAAAENVTLMWDPSPDPTVKGYVLYIGTQSGVYSQTHDVGATTSFVFAVEPGKDSYYFSIASYSAGPLIGERAAEVRWTRNRPPVLTNPGPQQGSVGTPVSLQLKASDPEQSDLSYSAAGLPPGVYVNSAGAVIGTPTGSGSFVVTANVSDGVLGDTETFTWAITPPPADVAPPGISISVPGTGNDPVIVVGGNPDPTPPGADTPAGFGPSIPTPGPTSPPTPAVAANPSTPPPAVSLLPTSTGYWPFGKKKKAAPPSPASTARPTLWKTLTASKSAAAKPSGGIIGRLKTAAAASALANADAPSSTPPSSAAASTAAMKTSGAAGNRTSFASSLRAKAAAVKAAKTITTNHPFITLAGTAADNRAVKRVAWTTDRGRAGKATGTDTWIAGVPLERGLNKVTITVQDAAGNESAGTVTVQYDAPAAVEVKRRATPRNAE